jgi:hypothetical protein
VDQNPSRIFLHPVSRIFIFHFFIYYSYYYCSKCLFSYIVVNFICLRLFLIKKNILNKFVTIRIFIEKCVNILIGKCASSYPKKSAKVWFGKIHEIFFLGQSFESQPSTRQYGLILRHRGESAVTLSLVATGSY